MAKRNEFVSFHPVHPGEILKEELLERRITSKELAGRVGISPQNMSDYITGRRSFTVDFSCKLEEVLGIKARMWMDLQANYEITKRRVEGLSEECQKALQDGVVPQRISARVEWTAADKYVARTNYCEKELIAEGATPDDAKKALEAKLGSIERTEERPYFIEWSLSTSALLRELPVSLKALASASGLNPRQLSAYKNGTKAPDRLAKEKILQGLRSIGNSLSRVTLW